MYTECSSVIDSKQDCLKKLLKTVLELYTGSLSSLKIE